jgi:hypothetical protein
MVFIEKPEGKISLARPRSRWEDNIKMTLREVRYEDQWRALGNKIMNLRVP